MTLPNKSYTVTAVLVTVLVLWMLSGQLQSSSKNTDASADIDSSASALMKVEVQKVYPRKMDRKLTLQGQLQAKRQLLVRADTYGTVQELPVTKGSRVAAGALLAKLSLDGRAAELKEAQAMVRTANSEQKAALKLQKQGLQSQVKAEQAQAALAAASAKLERMALEISQTSVSSPFAGVINDLPIEIGQQVERGAVIAQLIDDSAFRVIASAAQQSVRNLHVGQPVSVRLITGVELEGKITFISAVANAQTRSFSVEAIIDNSTEQIAAGISASMIIPVETLDAFFISPSTLALSENGDIGIKSVDTDNTVQFFPIELVQTNSEGAWVTGVPSGTQVITLGQGFVNQGQKVEAVGVQPVTDIDTGTDTDTEAKQ